jgi:plastocyanin
MTRKLTLIAAVLAVALGAVALGVVAASALASGGANAAKSKTVKVRDSYFSPKKLSVKKGTKLRFVWRGRLPHNIVGPRTNIRARVKGSASVRARSGSYVCTIHRGMKLVVKVR